MLGQRLVEKVDVVQAAVPSTARAAPASSTSRTAPALRSPPPTWTGTLHPGDDPADVLEVDGGAAARAVEVDDVQHARAVARPALRGLQGIGVVDGLLVEVAAGQPHRLALEDVDRRQQDHARAETPAPPTRRAAGCQSSSQHSTKLRSMRSPCPR